MMRARICSGVAIAWASCCCAGGCTTAGATGRKAHRRWIESLTWAQPAERVGRRRLSVGDRSPRGAPDRARRPAGRDRARRSRIGRRVGWLRCFRGIDTLTAMLILAELHDFRRFQSPRALMAYLGLVPGEDSSGEKHRRGRITRTGQCAGPPAAGGNGVALSTSAERRRRPDAATQRTTGPGHCDRGQGAAATVSPLPAPGGTTQARAQDRRGDRARAGGLPLGGAPTGTGRGEIDGMRCDGEPVRERDHDAGR